MSKVLGIAQFAKRAGVEEASARVMLRKIEYPRKERSYEFKSNDEIDKLIAKARAAKPEPKKAKKSAVKTKKKAPAKKKPKPVKKVKEEAASEE